MNTADLRGTIHGQVLSHLEPGFDDARSLWNTRLDRRPDLVARCVDAADVQTIVAFAQREQLTLSVKGGGHSYAANSVRDGGILIDLSPMKAIQVDPESRTVTIGGGVMCRELDAATQAHGLAVPLPTASSVGVVGAALGGGSGYLHRAYGLCLDNLVSAQVVTADAKTVQATSTDNADLYWAIRGGGGNFGIVTSMTLRLHRVGPEVLSGQIIYPFENATDLLRSFRTFMAQAPDTFQCYPFMFRVPPIDLFPKETHGQPVLDFVLFHQDPKAADFVRPLRNLGDPILDLVGPAPYTQVQQSFDANLPSGQRYYSKAHDLDDLTDAAIDTVVEYVPSMRGEFTAAYFEPEGGAFADVGASETAYGSRKSAYGFHCLAGWINPADDEAVMSWAASLHGAMAQHASGSVYVNLIADDEGARIPLAYGDNYARLVALKGRWDPSNLFGSNYNIPPA